MAEDIEKIPPQNLEAEQSVLGAMLIDPDAIINVADILNETDFYKETHGFIFEAMTEVFDQHLPIDLLNISNRLLEKNQLELIGGRAYLSELTNIVPTASNVTSYAKIVQKKATLRRLLKAGNEITAIAYKEEEDPDGLLDLAEQTLFSVSQSHLQQNFTPITKVLSETFERIDELHRGDGSMRGIPTGFTDLDNLLSGLQKSDLVILAARPSVGKTTFALDIAREAAVKNKTKVGIFSLEMSKEQLVDRLLATQAGIDLWKMRTGKLSHGEGSDEFPRIGQAMGVLSEAPIFIDDTPMANIMQIRTKCRRLQTEHGLDLIIIDYLQLMEGRNSSAGENRVQEVSEISRGLKAVARELQVPVLALSQLSRAVETTKPAIPKLAHLRESGSIEQDADIVMFVYRKATDRNYQESELTPEEKNTAEIHIAKHRNGPTGVTQLFFDSARVSFKNLKNAPPPSQ
ncbi:MAG: replicative DNA helicase [Candidatus Jacksonbacteria bacterium]|jgi:replicative DNA helicase|nr:replicative DNA helicase [Candidatus Jacksonbacteria bacterium]MBT6034714.1 replicative DNA helicase [Candidatus Jacksonbacteria bacterium]MBT6301135.1 replicative DNA helicase [Candidatus Jacksonbacteria bacterium]MBT6757282.1 replicative DNA helicase [Candidatus Jacksonbacteria bacterium]MBT6955637.1 replicative DNA helicase [Candidatus Jacksonbacteria bacterium]